MLLKEILVELRKLNQATAAKVL